jgi:hypothetical protein
VRQVHQDTLLPQTQDTAEQVLLHRRHMPHDAALAQELQEQEMPDAAMARRLQETEQVLLHRHRLHHGVPSVLASMRDFSPVRHMHQDTVVPQTQDTAEQVLLHRRYVPHDVSSASASASRLRTWQEIFARPESASEAALTSSEFFDFHRQRIPHSQETTASALLFSPSNRSIFSDTRRNPQNDQNVRAAAERRCASAPKQAEQAMMDWRRRRH